MIALKAFPPTISAYLDKNLIIREMISELLTM